MKIEHRLPTAAEFITLRAQTDWGVPNPSIVKTVLKRSFSGIVAMEGDQVVGMARTVGDGILILYLQDVIISSTHRNQGLGRLLINKLLIELEKNCSQNCTIGLFAAIGQAGFYESLGFSTRGNSTYGPGMHGSLSELAKARNAA